MNISFNTYLIAQLTAVVADRDRLAFENRVLQHEIDLLRRAFTNLNRQNGITTNQAPTPDSAAATPLDLEF